MRRLLPEEWYALSDAKKAKLRKEREDAKKAKEAGDKKSSSRRTAMTSPLREIVSHRSRRNCRP